METEAAAVVAVEAAWVLAYYQTPVKAYYIYNVYINITIFKSLTQASSLPARRRAPLKDKRQRLRKRPQLVSRHAGPNPERQLAGGRLEPLEPKIYHRYVAIL